MTTSRGPRALADVVVRVRQPESTGSRLHQVSQDLFKLTMGRSVSPAGKLDTPGDDL